MITKQIIDQIEGEASVYFDMKDDVVDFATVAFPHFRGMENILEGKNALDALVITPRVCGICGHAHLMASVRAIEDAYKNAGHPITLSNKADTIREFTLFMETIQNHFKWIYLVIIPELEKLHPSTHIKAPLKGAYAASLAAKAIATFGGQWPHSSYMVPGGVTCDPTHIDRLKAVSHLEELIHFFEKETLGMSLDDFLSFESCKDFKSTKSDIFYIEQELRKNNMHNIGKAYDRFVIFGAHNYVQPSKIIQTRNYKIDAKYVTTSDAHSPSQKSYAQNALYKEDFYEAGPLARSISNDISLIKNIHRKYKDSAYTRVISRISELGVLLRHTRTLLQKMDISEKSFYAPVDISKITAKGVGIVEAPRGPLIHKIDIKEGVIQEYKIITPTQWNIGSATKENPTPVQKAMQGVNKQEALFIFRTFDVCSVCTTH